MLAYYELHKAIDNQTVINLVQDQLTTITVYVNGIEVSEYTKVASVITFDNPLVAKDMILIKCDKDIIQIDNIQKYSNTIKFLENQTYNLELKLPVINHTEFLKTNLIWFTSRYSPLYSSSKLIKMDLTSWLEGVNDDLINYAIYETSIFAESIAVDDISETPDYLKYYVRYKTEMDLLTSVYLGQVKFGGTVTKTLGDLTISRKPDLPSLDELLAIIRRKLAPYESQLLGATARPMPLGAVRAGKTAAFSLASRVSF